VSLTGPEWTRRYEVLRAHATGEAALGFVPLGLALLWHRGVAAWMAAESSAIGAGGSGERVVESKVVYPLEAPRSELVRLLAGTAILVAQGRSS